MDVRVLLFTFALSVGTGIVFGLAPAVQATKPELSGAMKEGGRGSSGDGGRRRVRSILVAGEVALAFMLLVGGGLLVRSFFHMMSTELGFDPANVLTFRLPIANDRFPARSHLTSYVREVVARINSVPGITGAAAADALPLQGWNNGMPFQIAGREFRDRANRDSAGFKMVQPDYFRVLGVRLVKGRTLTDRDVKGSPPVAVINERMATRYFKGEDPIGQRLLIQEIVPGSPQLGPEIPWEVVGVIGDERTASLEGTQRPGVYVSIDQSPTTEASIVVRARIDPDSLQRAIRQVVHELDKTQAVTDVRTIEEIKNDSAGSSRLRTMLLTIFAALALLLSAVGIYGVISYSVVQRTHEIGVRAALGASRSALVWLVLGHGMALATAGLAAGLAGSLALTRLLSSLLVGVGARDPRTMGEAAALLAAVALLACYIPARRAATLDPLVALRRE